MRRILLTFLVLVSASLLFAVDNFFFINATTRIGASGATYRFDYSTVFNLSDHFNGTPRYNDYAGQSNPNGELNSSRAMGTCGVSGCSDRIIYTISTNGGAFVSQSDPSKYREYYVVVVPYISVQVEATDRYYYYYGSDTASSPAPSTRNGDLHLRTVTTDGTDVSGRIVLGGTSWWPIYGYPYSMGFEMFICMDQITNADLLHLAELDDYLATITVSWACENGSCTDNHYGSFDITVRGYYGTNQGEDKDSFFLLLNPTAESTNLNIKDLARTAANVTIADFRINTTTRSNNFSWSDHLFAFLSASPDYNVPDYNGFFLKKVGSQSITIPYNLTVYNTTNGVKSDNKREYDGTDYFTNKSSAHSFCLDLSDYKKISHDAFQDTYQAINYEGTVELQIQDFQVPGSGNSFSEIMRNPADDNNRADYTSYIGKYESNIYYHIVYAD